MPQQPYTYAKFRDFVETLRMDRTLEDLLCTMAYLRSNSGTLDIPKLSKQITKMQEALSDIQIELYKKGGGQHTTTTDTI